MAQPLPIQAGPVELWSIPATVQCGFPSPAEDHSLERLDVRALLVRQPDATYFMRARGLSMRDAGIDDGDYVIIDRSLQARHGHIVVAVIDGEFTLKRLHQRAGRIQLQAANPDFADLPIHHAQELSIWGVVTWTLKHHAHASP